MPSRLVLFLALLAFIVALTNATTIAQLSSQFNIQEDADSFTGVTIASLDGVTIDFVDSDYDSTKPKDTPLLIYGDKMVLKWTRPSSVPDDSPAETKISFFWCEKDSSTCDKSTETVVATVPTVSGTAEFPIPTLAFTSIFSSNVKFRLKHTVGSVSLEYNSKYTYESDVTTKAKKSIATVIIVFVIIMILMGLAVLGYLIFKKVKKMRRGRHFGSEYIHRRK